MFHRVKSEAQPEEFLDNNNDAQEEPASSEKKQGEQSSNSNTNTQKISTASTEENKAMNDTLEQDVDTQEDKTSFSYQRPAPAAQAVPAGRPAYAGSAPYTPTSGYGSAPRRDNAPAQGGKDRCLTIGAGITMSGEIESCDYLLVEGTVEAALKGANVLEIAESGTFYGTVEIGEANIAGRFEGDITVHGRLTISSTGTVTGTIAYKELEIEAGAVIDGKLTPLSAVSKGAAAPSEKAEKPSTAKASPSKAKAKKDDAQQEPANNEGGLFSKAAAE